MGAAHLDDVSGLEGQRDPAQRPGHRRAHHAQPDGAVPDGRLRLSLAARAAHDDRGQEARLCRSDPVRRRSAIRRGASRRDARQGPGPDAGGTDRPGACAVPRRALATRSRHRHAGARHDLPVGRRSRRQHGVADPEQLSWASGPGWFPTAPASCSTTAARCSRWRRISPTRLRAASARCTRSSPASWRRTARGFLSASWAAGTRRRPTRSLSPTSPTTASRRRKRSKPDVSRRPRSRAVTCRWKP